MIRRTIVIAALLALSMAACGNDEPGTGGTPAGIRSTASISIAEPKQGAVLKADSIPVEISLRGGRVLEQASTDIRPDTGHMHVVLDNTTVSVLAGATFDLVEVLAKEKQPPITPGRHILTVEFANAAHQSFSPKVLSSVTFTVA